jgi:Fusaric acid resistance protein-like
VLTEILADSFRWTRSRSPPAFQVIAAAIGVAGPVALGAAIGDWRLGTAASLGGLALSRGGQRTPLRLRMMSMAASAPSGALAMAVGAAIARIGDFALFLVPALSAVAALLGGINRSSAVVAARSTFFAIIATGTGAAAGNPIGLAIRFLLGAVWTGGLSFAMELAFHPRRVDPKPGEVDLRALRQPTGSDEFRRWRKSLGGWSCWQYSARTAVCLTVTEGLALLFPSHHAYWVSLTVAIVVRRQYSQAVTRAFQRALGTVLGVMLAMLLFLWSPTLPALLGMIGVLAAARPVLRVANYLAYSAVMTPLIMLLLDLGQRPSLAIMLDRLVATIVGCALALTLGYLAWPRPEVRPRAQTRLRRREQSVR